MKERLRKDDRNCLLLFILRFLSPLFSLLRIFGSVTGEAGNEKTDHNSILTRPVTFYRINQDSVTGPPTLTSVYPSIFRSGT